jgi:hypothetical protein
MLVAAAYCAAVGLYYCGPAGGRGWSGAGVACKHGSAEDVNAAFGMMARTPPGALIVLVDAGCPSMSQESSEDRH